MNKDWKFFLAFISSAIFFGILIMIVAGTPNVDFFVKDFVNQVQIGNGGDFFYLFSSEMDKILIGISIITFCVLYFGKRKKESFILAVSLSLGYLGGDLIKIAIQRPRPLMSLIQESGYSFPSNHAVFAMILFSLIVYFFIEKINNNLLKKLFVIINFLMVFVVGASRIYLGVHWFTDVFGGFMFGIIILCFVILYSEKRFIPKSL